MDEVDQRFVDRTKAYVDCIFPGLTTRLERIRGSYRSATPPKHTPARFNRPRAFQLEIEYRADVRGGLHIKIQFTAEEHPPGEWRVVQHCYHLGDDRFASSADDGEAHLRVCLSNRTHHFHLPGYRHAFNGGHIPASRAVPPLQNTPDWFMDVVENYVATGTMSIGVRP